MSEPISFEPNQRLRLGLSQGNRELAVDVAATENELLWLRLAEPALGVEAHHLAEGVRLSFWREGARHVAEQVSVVGFDLDRGRIQIRLPQETKIVQRRKTFREPVEVPVRLLPVDRGPATVDLSPREAVTQDIGGGGICARARTGHGIAVGDELQVELALPERAIRARGRVQWSKLDEDGTTRLGVAFTRIAEREQDSVYGYLFELQRSRLRVS